MGYGGTLSGRRLPPERAVALRYVALGDSTVVGVGASRPELGYAWRIYERLRAVYPDARFANLGVGGATAADVVAGQLARAIGLRPDLVTLSVGPNDIIQGDDAAAFGRAIAEILRRLAAETSAVVALNLIPDLAVAPVVALAPAPWPHQAGARTGRYNEALACAAAWHGAEVVDLYGPSRRGVPRHSEWVAPDGFHPSDEGYARWAELLWRGVQARMVD